MVKRAAFVTSAVAELGLDAEVLEMRAETMAADPRWAHNVDVVVARSLAAPAVAAEYVAPLLRVGGNAVIAEPPGGDPARWPVDGLAKLGLQRGPVLFAPTATLQVLDTDRRVSGEIPPTGRRGGQIAALLTAQGSDQGFRMFHVEH